MKKVTIDTVRLGKTSDEPKTRYLQSNEDRLNMNFRRLAELVEELQEEIEKLKNP